MKSKPADATVATAPTGGSVQKLSLVLPADLHRRIKFNAAKSGTTMVQDIVKILMEHYPPDAGE